MNFRLVFKLTGKTLLARCSSPCWSACSTAKIPSLSSCPLP